MKLDNRAEKPKTAPVANEAEGDPYFGGCPICHGQGFYTNVGKNHWFYCDKHRVRWSGGYNLMSTWQFETEEEQREKFKKIADYDVVEPWFPGSDDPWQDIVHLAYAYDVVSDLPRLAECIDKAIAIIPQTSRDDPKGWEFYSIGRLLGVLRNAVRNIQNIEAGPF